MPVHQPNQQMQSAPEKDKYMARFVKDSHGDGLRVQPNQEFNCSWTYRNTGKTAWPKGTSFIRTAGDDMVQSQPALLPDSVTVEPEQEHTFDLKLVAPTKPGRYTAFFRLQHNQMRFGQKVWADILVVEPVAAPMQVVEPEPVMQVVSPQTTDVDMEEAKGPKMVPQDSFEIVKKEDAKPEENLNVSQSMMMTPRQIYLNHMETYALDEDLKQKMATLFEFGFVDFEQNLDLLRKNKGDLEAVASFLSDQLLAKSTY